MPIFSLEVFTIDGWIFDRYVSSFEKGMDNLGKNNRLKISFCSEKDLYLYKESPFNLWKTS